MILTFAKCFEEKGIFSLFNEIDSAFISEILPDEDLTIFDDYSVFSIGNYPIFNSSFTPEKLARFCLIKNKTAWKKFNDSLIAEFNLSGKTTTENNTTNIDSDRTNNLKVNGYDDSQLVTDTETTDNSDIEQTETKTRTETRENPSEVIERNIITQKNNKLVDMIVSDIKNTICLDSLDSCTINDDYSGGETDLKERVETLENKVETIESDILTIDEQIDNINDDVSDIKKIIPNNASESNKLATMADISGGGSVTIDDTLSTLSENPVQNKVITNKINQVENSIPDVSGLATKSELQAVENSIPDVSGFATKQELQAVENSIPDVSGFATISELQAVENSIPDVSGFATKQELQAVENSIPDATNFVDTTTYNADKQVIRDDIQDNTDDIAVINTLIPQNASHTNKLATMADISGGYEVNENNFIDTKITKNINGTTYYVKKIIISLSTYKQLINNSQYVDVNIFSSNNATDVNTFLGKINNWLMNYTNIFGIDEIKIYGNTPFGHITIDDVSLNSVSGEQYKRLGFCVFPDLSIIKGSVSSGGISFNGRYMELTVLTTS